MDINLLIILGGLVFSSLCLGFLIFGQSEEAKIRKSRLESLSHHQAIGITTTANGALEAEQSIRKKTQEKSKFLALLNRIAPKQAELKALLARSGKSLSIGQLVGLMAITGLILFMLLNNIFGLNGLFALLFGFAGGIMIPLTLIKKMAERRLTRFLRDFPDAIDLMVRGLRSGLPVSESIASVSREFDGPIGQEFMQVIETVQFGVEMEKALWQMADRLPSPDVKFFVITLSIQKDTGGNLADTLNNLSAILRSRKQMVLKVKALSSEAKASAMILGGLPFALFAVLSLVSPEYIFMLFEDDRGHVMLAVGGGLIFIGVMIMRKLVQFRI